MAFVVVLVLVRLVPSILTHIRICAGIIALHEVPEVVEGRRRVRRSSDLDDPSVKKRLIVVEIAWHAV